MANEMAERLLALIGSEKFIGKEIQETAIKHQGDDQLLRELYCCAWDNLSGDIPDDIRGDVKKLRRYRYEYITNAKLGECKASISDINTIVETVEEKIASIGQTVTDLQKDAQGFSSMFNEVKPSAGSKTMNVEEAAKQAGRDNQPVKSVPVPDSGTAEIVPKRRLSWKEKRDYAAYISLLTKEGYDREQIDYVFHLLEDGLKPQEIERFIHPGLTVWMMEKCRKLKERSKEKGKKEEVHHGSGS